MANLFAQNSSVNINSANQWNTAANGSGSYVAFGDLTAADVLMANGKTGIAINVNTTVSEVRTDTTGGATAGGGFTLNDGVILTANVFAGTASCVTYAGAGLNSANIVGNITGGSGSTCYGLAHTSTGTINITGNVYGSIGTSSNGIRSTSSGTVNISGSVNGGDGTTAYGANNYSTGNLNITGNATAGTGLTSYGAFNSSSGIITLFGTIQASNYGSGIYSSATGSAIIVGPLKATSSAHMAVYGHYKFHSSMVGTYHEVYDTDNVKRTLYTTNYEVGGLPSVGNVRSGTTFGPASELTGTLAVPPAASVAYGVPVDNTTGTAAITTADISSAVWDTLVADLDTANSIGARLAQAATVPSTGAQIAALGV